MNNVQAGESRRKDPVCGMMVDPATARGGSHAHKGNTYFFCNPRCRERFMADPEKYLDPAYKPGGMSGMVQLGGIAPAAKAAAPAAALATPAPDKPAESATSTATKPAVAPPGIYTCPMDPEVRQAGPGICPVCGMALEPETIELPTVKTEYVCPMHAEVVRDEAGDCPTCGMALEPRSVSAAAPENPELRDMSHRLKVSLWLGVPLLTIAMAHMATPLAHAVRADLVAWIELALASPIVVWCGLPFFERARNSFRFRSPNMFTLIGIGVGPRTDTACSPRFCRESFRPRCAETTGSRRSISKRLRRSPFWSWWGRCWNCVRVDRPGAQFAPCSIFRRA